MDFEIYSYRFAKEIVEHPTYNNAIREITWIVRNCPLFIWPNKSASNHSLDIVQQLINAYFDVQFHCLNDWEFHPLATNIANSGLSADFRKSYNDLTIQTEVQFGNMSRWYSDIFKFQTAYSQQMINMGLCIIPFNELATNFERCVREIESAEMSITLPIIFIGLKLDHHTTIIDVSTSGFTSISQITRGGNSNNLYRIVNSYLENSAIQSVSAASPIGFRP
jgi:hypothetical protein